MKDVSPVNPSIYPSPNPYGIKIPFYIAEDLRRAMKVSDILKIVKDCEMLRNILLSSDEELSTQQKTQICDLLWDYRCELLKKEVE